MRLFAAEWGTGEVFWSMLWFFLFFIWIWLLIIVFSDIFRSHDLSGWVKAIWIIFVILRAVPRRLRLPDRPRSQDAGPRHRGRQSAGRGVPPVRAVGAGSGTSSADELARLADLKAQGVLSEDEFQKAKAKVLAT